MINFFTIVLDGMPWVTKHLPVFSQLRIPWRWIIVEGVANNANCTQWCSKLEPRFSRDGTSEYLCSIADHPCVTLIRKPFWKGGKVEMCNAALNQMNDAGLLWQVDSDEVWSLEKIMAVDRLFAKHSDKNCAYFWCRYFVGKDIVTTTRGTWGNNNAYEWKRVWRFEPGIRFARHEPPVLNGFTEKPILHTDTEAAGAIFDHYAYATLGQVQFKAEYYAGERNPHGQEYRACVTGWERLQNHKGPWPVKLQDYLPFVPDDVRAMRL